MQIRMACLPSDSCRANAALLRNRIIRARARMAAVMKSAARGGSKVREAANISCRSSFMDQIVSDEIPIGVGSGLLTGCFYEESARGRLILPGVHFD
jgi:hypothetical protein